MRLNIVWKNINSDSITGLMICELPPITKPKMRTRSITIDGRDGEIIEELGYSNYTKSIKIALTKNFDIDEVIKYFTGQGNLILSNEPTKFYKGRITDAIDYDKLIRFKTAVVRFNIEPFKYLLNEESAELTPTEEVELVVKNNGLEISKPKIFIRGSGTVELVLNNSKSFTYNFPENETEVIIDSDKEEAEIDGVLKNRNMVGDFFFLNAGDNVISWSGNLTYIKVYPNSRWL